MKWETMYPEGVRGVVFVHNPHGPQEPDALYLRHFVGEECTDVGFQDVIKRFELEESQTKVLARRVLEAMLEQWANPKVQQFFYGHMWSSAILAARTYLPDDHELLKRLLLATVVYYGGHSKDPVSLLRAVVPQEKIAKVKQTDDDKNRLSGLMPEKALQLVINQMLRSGCTEKEIRSAWTDMLRTRQRDRFKTACITEWWKELMVGESNLQKEAEPIACQLLLYELQDILVNGCFDWNNPHYSENNRAPEDFLSGVLDFLLSQTSYDWHAHNEETQELVESYFVQCLARGKVGTAHYMLVRYGKWFGLWSEYANKSENKPNAVMERLMRVAIEKAKESRNYGVATALAEYLGETETADHLREMARSLKQRVALDHAFYHAVSRHE